MSRNTLNHRDKVGKMRPRIALTMGDPAGIGPELAVRAAQDPAVKAEMDVVIYGSHSIISKAAERFANGAMLELAITSNLHFNDVPIGQENAACGKAALDAVRSATMDVLNGRIDAIVTCPMNKASVNLAGIPFTGHTEYIAELCGCDNYAMMQSAGDLRVIFVTTHIALNKVAEKVTFERIVEVTRLLNQAVMAEGISTPKLAAAAVNPHAGEQGFMGREDEDTVKPALEFLRKEGIDISGPFPPDTLFIENIRKKFDGIVSMYHDQGHIPFKMLAFDRGVNSTMGLPIIRTSVDHGTAFEIAWQGIADTGSLTAALHLAALRTGKLTL